MSRSEPPWSLIFFGNLLQCDGIRRETLVGWLASQVDPPSY